MTNYEIAREYLPTGIHPIDLTGKRLVYEISIPTCSYRMGVDRIGYGVLLLDSGRISSSSRRAIRFGLLSRDENGSSDNSVHAKSVSWLVSLRNLCNSGRSLLDRHVGGLETNTDALVAHRSIISCTIPSRHYFALSYFDFNTQTPLYRLGEHQVHCWRASFYLCRKLTFSVM